jgi:hypothetical protein
MAFAPRPHVELVHAVDMPAKDVLLPGANKPARLIVLSESPVNKAVSAVLDIPAGWERERGRNDDTFVEHYLLAGDLKVGEGLQLLPHHYFRTEISATSGPFRSVHGARILYFTEGDPMNWTPVSQTGPDISEGITHINTNVVPWGDIFVAGPPVTEEGSTLKIKLLYMDPRTKAYTRLILAEKGWHDHRTAHHPVVEEAYTIHGHMTYNYGALEVDTYFYRPPRIKHGFFQAYPDGTVWIIRSDGELENIYTEPDGTPVNWEPGTEREPVHIDPPVRSERAGPWDGSGQHIPPPEKN